jgi:NADH-quinone oxidoreductase subunit L
VLAYSTVSQLGLMFLAMGVGAFGAGIFHLYTHAFFKALLFLGSGAVIHALHGEQDIRNMGGLKRYLPITYWTFLIGSLAIAGVPGLAGFFSKDEILFETFAGGHTILWLIGAMTSLLTATYMFRLVFLTFHGERRVGATLDGPVDAHGHGAASSHGQDAGSHRHDADPHRHGALHDAPPAMAFALIVLALGSVLAGYVGVPGHNVMATWLAPSFGADPRFAMAQGAATAAGQEPAPETVAEGAEAHDEAALEITLMVVSSAIALLGIGLAAFIWLKRREIAAEMARRFEPIYRLLLNKYYVDEVYDAAIIRPIEVGSREGLWRGIDVRVVDGAVNGMAAIVAGGAWVLRRLQTGSVRAYAGSVILGVVLILGYYLWS